MLEPRYALLVAGTARIADHTDMKTTMRYVHPSDADMDEAIVKAREDQGGHTSGHTGERGEVVIAPVQRQGIERERFSGATRQDRTGDLLITNQPLYQLS